MGDFEGIHFDFIHLLIYLLMSTNWLESIIWFKLIFHSDKKNSNCWHNYIFIIAILNGFILKCPFRYLVFSLFWYDFVKYKHWAEKMKPTLCVYRDRKNCRSSKIYYTNSFGATRFCHGSKSGSLNILYSMPSLLLFLLICPHIFFLQFSFVSLTQRNSFEIGKLLVILINKYKNLI